MTNDGRRWLAWHHPRMWWVGRRSHPARQVLYGAILMAVIIAVLLLLAHLGY